MDTLSLKNYIIDSLSEAPTIEEFKTNDVILITACGIISGKPAPLPDKGNNEIGILNQLSIQLAKNYNKSRKEEGKATESDFIILRDVTIRSNATTSHLEELVTFFDQVIGITIGKIK